jgi:hypothetical protein
MVGDSLPVWGCQRAREAQMLKLGAIALDGNASVQTVADKLLTMIFGDPPDQSV